MTVLPAIEGRSSPACRSRAGGGGRAFTPPPTIFRLRAEPGRITCALPHATRVPAFYHCERHMGGAVDQGEE